MSNTLKLTPKKVNKIIRSWANEYFPHMDDDHGIACVEDLLLIEQTKKDSLKKIKKISTKKKY